MDEPCNWEDLHRALVQQWGVGPIGSGRPGREALLEELRRRVDFLLRHDFDRLISCMYMLDVPEEKFTEAVRRPPHEQPDRLLADIILEREIERMQTRRRYARQERTDIAARIEDQRQFPHLESDGH